MRLRLVRILVLASLLGIVASGCAAEAVERLPTDGPPSMVAATPAPPEPSTPPASATGEATTTTTTAATNAPEEVRAEGTSANWSGECEDALSRFLAFQQDLVDVAAGWDLAAAMDPDLEAVITGDPGLASRVEELTTLGRNCDEGALAVRAVARSEELVAGNLPATVFKAVSLRTSLQVIGYADPALVDELVEPSTVEVPVSLEEIDWSAATTCADLRAIESGFLHDLMTQLDSLTFDELESGVSVPDPAVVLEGIEYQRLSLRCDLIEAATESITDLGEFRATSFPAAYGKLSLINRYLDDRLRDLVGREPLGQLDGSDPPGRAVFDLVVDPTTLEAFLLVINRHDEALEDISISLNGRDVLVSAIVAPHETAAFPATVRADDAAWTWEYRYATKSGGTVNGSRSRF